MMSCHVLLVVNDMSGLVGDAGFTKHFANLPSRPFTHMLCGLVQKLQIRSATTNKFAHLPHTCLCSATTRCKHQQGGPAPGLCATCHPPWGPSGKQPTRQPVWCALFMPRTRAAARLARVPKPLPFTHSPIGRLIFLPAVLPQLAMPPISSMPSRANFASRQTDAHSLRRRLMG